MITLKFKDGTSQIIDDNSVDTIIVDDDEAEVIITSAEEEWDLTDNQRIVADLFLVSAPVRRCPTFLVMQDYAEKHSGSLLQREGCLYDLEHAYRRLTGQPISKEILSKRAKSFQKELGILSVRGNKWNRNCWYWQFSVTASKAA
jgi:hypothetical protein